MLKEIFDFDLSPDSIVFDVGGYHGLWTEFLIEALGFSPNVYIFEPVRSRIYDIQSKFKNNSKVRIIDVGLGRSNRKTIFAIAGDATGAWSVSSDIVPVTIQDIWEVARDANIGLISINCEGGEYDILERMLETDIVKNCKYIQVQFHNLFPEASDRRDKIREALAQTHTEKYNISWAWEAWQRRS